MASKLSSSESFSIEPAECPADVQYAVKLAVMEEWNIAENDIPNIISLSPKQLFIAKLNGRNIGCLIVLMLNPNHAFLRYFVIEKGYRGRGYGSRLFEVALASLGPSCSAMLDAVERMCPYYEQRGFKHYWKAELHNFTVTAVSRYLSKLEELPHVRITPSLEEIGFAALAAYDRSVSSEPRYSWLKKWIYETDGSSWVAVDITGKIVGYTVCHVLLKDKSGKKRYRISPLFADDPLTARQLLQAVANYCSANKEEQPDSTILCLQFPTANPEALKLCKEMNGKFKETLVKMYTEGAKKQDASRTYIYYPC